MLDILYVLFALIFFASCLAMIRGLDKLKE
jgi:hypothetical protein